MSKTTISIAGEDFQINGRLTYAGRRYRGMRIEGLLLNSRMVQGIFDDVNPNTRSNWDYPDGPWDPDRNTDAFVAAMSEWRRHGLLSFTINLQGGNPRGYGDDQPWHNSAYEADGALRPDYMARLEKILVRADELGMTPIVGLFYFGQDQRLADEQAVINAADLAVDWLLQREYAHVLIEVANEADYRQYTHAIIQPKRGHELIRRVQQRSQGRVSNPHKRLLVSTSFQGGSLPSDNVLEVVDFVLLHGNAVRRCEGIAKLIDDVRASAGYRGQPIVFNEDDHFDFDAPDNHMLTAIDRHVSWGYFDYRMAGEPFACGYQSVPADWAINSDRKKGFFRLLAEVTSARQ